jgi:hypothetical protein
MLFVTCILKAVLLYMLFVICIVKAVLLYMFFSFKNSTKKEKGESPRLKCFHNIPVIACILSFHIYLDLCFKIVSGFSLLKKWACRRNQLPYFQSLRILEIFINLIHCVYQTVTCCEILFLNLKFVGS